MIGLLAFSPAVAALLTAFCLLAVMLLVLGARSLSKRQHQTLPGTKGERETKPLTGAPFWGLAVFTLAWSSGVLYFDGKLVHGTVKQLQARDYPTVEGSVLKSEVKEESSGEGTTYDLVIEYTYDVQNQGYTSDRVRYLKLWDRAWVSHFVADHPVNSLVTVSYDPEEPAQAVLLPGLGGQELFLPLFLLPFNLIMIWLWCAPLTTWFFGGTGCRSGVRTIEKPEEVRVRLPKTAPALAGFGILTAGCFVGVFVAFCCAGMPPSVAVMVLLWSIVLGSGGLVYLLLAIRVTSGKADLVINQCQRTLTLPQTFGRKEPVVVPLGNLLAIPVVAVRPKDKEGRRPLYAPTVRWRDTSGASKDEKLAEWGDKEQAERLAAWIAWRTGLASPPVEG
jgi:hypothetical protein